VKFLRTLPTSRLIMLIVGVLAVSAAGAAIAVAARSGGPTPPPKPLDQAIHDALAAPAPDGVTARITFTNTLFPSGAILGNVGSALMSGASGRLWMTNDGRGRIELQSDAGDVQIVWNTSTVTIYDASSNTVYRADLPASKGDASSTADNGAPPALADIDKLLTTLGAHATVSAAQPMNVAGQPAYSVTVSPAHDGGLLGSVELAFDAARGVPLRLAVYAQGSSSPVLGLEATDISYGAVAASDVDVSPPAGAKVVDLSSAQGASSSTDSSKATPAITGLAAVQAAANFPVTVPDTLVGLPLKDVRLVGATDSQTAIAVYGQGLGAIVLVERSAANNKSGSAGSNPLSSLPTVSLDGVSAHELATQLGTVLAWQSGGTAYVLAGSLPAAAAEAAARAVK
jgi:outer membrane lipoprotein-sorting protein